MLRHIVQTKMIWSDIKVIVQTIQSFKIEICYHNNYIQVLNSVEDLTMTRLIDFQCLDILSDQKQKCSDKHQLWLEKVWCPTTISSTANSSLGKPEQAPHTQYMVYVNFICLSVCKFINDNLQV